MNNKNVNIFLHFHTFGSVKQYIFPVNEETSSPWKNNPQTKQREKKICPRAAVSHIPPPTSCLEYRQWGGCSGQRAISEGSSASIHYYKPCLLWWLSCACSRTSGVTQWPDTHCYRCFFFLAPSSMNVKTSCVSRNGMNTPGLLPKMHDWLRAIAHLG